MAAVEATLCAIEGTVTWARREDGRPALAGTGAGTGAATATTGLDLAGDEETAVGIVTDLAAGLGAGLETDVGGVFTAAFGAALATAWGLVAATGFLAGLGAAFEITLAAGLAAALATGLGTGFATLLAGAALAVFAAGLATTLATGFAAGLATTFLAAALTVGLAAGLAGLFTALLAALVGVALPDFVFTSCLLAGLACACSADTEVLLRPREGLSAGLSSARECTGSRFGKPISCKSETIIGLPNLVLFNVKKWHCAAVR